MDRGTKTQLILAREPFTAKGEEGATLSTRNQIFRTDCQQISAHPSEEVRFELIGDSTTPSGYAWSSSSGPPFEIDGGTKLNAAVVVERRKPYNYVLPMIKGAIGAS